MWTTQFNFWFKKIKLLCFYSITCLTIRYFITQVFHNFDLMVTRLCVAIFCLHSYSCCLILSIIQKKKLFPTIGTRENNTREITDLTGKKNYFDCIVLYKIGHHQNHGVTFSMPFCINKPMIS